MAMATVLTTGVLGVSLLPTSASTVAHAADNDCDPDDKDCNDLENCECDAYYQDCLNRTATQMANYYTFGCRGISHEACVQVVKQHGLCSDSREVCAKTCSK
jgi:hypothetical protein